MIGNHSALCVCGKLCTSKPGLTLHQRTCKAAQEAIAKGKSSIEHSGAEVSPKYCKEAAALLDTINKLAIDTHLAIVDKNKSAGRRARVSLLKLRDMIIPLRIKILNSTNK